jgi:hypothetical protein
MLERERIPILVFGGIDLTYIHGRKPNCTLDLFLRIYYHYFIFADD